ncbi:MAG: filamentous hemagglutinin family protein [Rhizomicrobium sp.]
MSALSSKTKSARNARRALLLASVSILSLMTATSAQAGDILRGNVLPAPAAAAAAATAASQQSAAAATRAQDSLLRTTQALQAMQSAQSAARSLAGSAPSTVPNGLAVGGLQVVDNPIPAAQDTTGTSTWDGANAPTQSTEASGHVDVNIKQTASRAILSWKSFNVGKDTTLTYDQQGNADWVALNRVVGAGAAPSQILGAIKSDGTVLIINQNGIIFGGTSQINTNSLIASTLEVGRSLNANGVAGPSTIANRDQEFLADGLLGYGDTLAIPNTAGTFSGIATSSVGSVQGTGKVTVQAGAQITSGDGGYILLTGPAVENAGTLSATDGQVILAAGDALILTEATGAAGSAEPGIRGLIAVPELGLSAFTLAQNDTGGIIQSDRGSIFLGSASTDGVKIVQSATVNQGGLFATTSVARNGAIQVSGSYIDIAPTSLIAITPDDNAGTVPQDPTSLADFKPSEVIIGNLGSSLNANSSIFSSINIESNSLLYAPSADVDIGQVPGDTSDVASPAGIGNGIGLNSRVFIDSGATIDVAGLKDVLVPASRNQIQIGPLKNNELADSPAYKDSFLNGATVTVDPRLSGVRDDGVAWIGSPLIDAKSYEQQVGVSASELMTTGGNVTIGAAGYSNTGTVIPDVIVKAGATIDISGGWVTYQGGMVKTTQLITSDGRIVDIGAANLTDTYVGIYTGGVVDHAHWGVTETFADPFGNGQKAVPTFNEGRDAGSLTIKASAAMFDGTIYAGAYAGPQQILAGQAGTGTSAVYGDERLMQGANSQLPAGGFLYFQALSAYPPGVSSATAPYVGGADIVVEAASDHQAVAADLAFGQSIVTAPDGTMKITTRDPASVPSIAQLSTIDLSDATLSASGLSQVSLHTSGAVTVTAKADVALNPGGVFDVLAGRTITVDGTVSVPSGHIALETFDSRQISLGGSVFSKAPATVGSFDVVVNGTLSTRGLWVNDYGASDAALQGSAWLDGGSISIYAAPRVASLLITTTGSAITPTTVTDLSGSIYINAGSSVDVSGGGYVGQLGALDLSAHGGDLSLYDETSYFQLTSPGTNAGASGFRVHGLTNSGGFGNNPYIPINPDQINSRVEIDPSAIHAQGFAGGGTFTLTTPEIAFGSDTTTSATELPLDFFSTAGFANYKITSYKTDIFANPFVNDLGGTDAILATQTLTVGAGQTLALTQSMLPSVLDAGQTSALRGLASGGDLFSVLTPSVPGNAWDSRPVNLTLGGLLELEVAQGGSITGAAGATLTVSKLLNEGTIRIAGGNIVQQEVLPGVYLGYNGTLHDTALGIHALSDIFSVNPDGSIDENAASTYSSSVTNAQLAGVGNDFLQYAIYLLGDLDADQGVVLAPGSVTDLSGTSIRNPYALDPKTGAPIVTGRMVDGGSLSTDPNIALPGQQIFRPQMLSAYASLLTAASSSGSVTFSGLDIAQAGLDMIVAPSAMLNLSGASDVYDLPVANQLPSANVSNYAPTPVWSSAGTLSAGAGATLTGATILAHGGSAEAEGGTLALTDPVLVQHDPDLPTAGLVSADMIAAAGFDTLVATGSVSSSGDVTVDLGRGFFLQNRLYAGNTPPPIGVTPGDNLLPTVKAGGRLEIDAPYVSFISNIDGIINPAQGTPGTGSVVFNAQAIDITGDVLFDQSVASATLNASGDVRLIGVQPWENGFPGITIITPTLTLQGALAVNGDLTINAAQIYPTTGSSFVISSTKAGGTIAFGRSGAATPATPYSAGGNLTVEAANIVQGGVLRVPLGTLTLGTTAAVTGFAPATQTVTLTDGSITAVSANGLVIPYGTTTDQTEWYFTPTDADPLTAPPAKLLALAGAAVDIQSGATVDLSGGGDVFAYEFVPGTGGSRDVLDQRNPDEFTGNNGYQYPDHRQIYAIVPGLSSAPVAANDPIYSANYGSLSSVSGVGSRVYLSGGNGLAAGWYTLLPAQYALLPGGMRVVQETGAKSVVPGTNSKLTDGSLEVAGYFGDALSGARSSQVALFTVQSQAVVAKESNIAQTTGNSYFAALAAHGGVTTPQLPVDAGRLVINPGASLLVDSVLSTAAGTGGRGAQVDIGGSSFAILPSLPQDAPADGTLRITASSLTNLNADSLLIGGTRSDNPDGSTTLNVTAHDILVQNDATTPLSAGEILLAATSNVTVADGAVITARGTLSDTRTGAYQIGSAAIGGATGTGALLRVANGPERLVARVNNTNAASLTVGAATLSGNAVMFDSSGANNLSPSLIISGAKFVAIGAPRIGLGFDPATFDGLAVTGALETLLEQSGAQLTFRSQSSIDFADGTYDFGSVRFDAGAMAGRGGAVVINADTVSLGNVSAAGAVCNDCSAADGTLAINASQILFTDGALATKASVLTTNVPVTLAADTTFILPAGTALPLAGSTTVTDVLTVPTRVTVPAGTTLAIAAGTGIILPGGADGALANGTTVTLGNGGTILPAGSYVFPDGYRFVFSGTNSGGSNAAGTYATGTATSVQIPVNAQVSLSAPAQSALTNFFGGGVTLSAQKGIFAQGSGSLLDTGNAALTLRTPYIGDSAVPLAAGVNATIPDLAFSSTNAVTIDNAGAAAIPATTGIPGASITINGESVAISGSTVNATAGTVAITSATGITLANGATVQAPGYSQVFGDAVDPVTQDAPGGRVTLKALNGDIDLGTGTTVSVGGGKGIAGTLELLADKGTVDFGGTIDAHAPDGGGSFTLATSGAFDLATLGATANAQGFTKALDIRTQTGDLTLAQGQTLTAGSVSLTADGGLLTVAGTIDTSGVNGGNVDLYGAGGVTLAGSAVIDAHATGYAADDTRQAEAGNVTLGTVGTGAITVADGALINVAATRPGDRLVPYVTNGVTYYNYVQGDAGGTVTFRAPLIDQAGADTVNVSVASANSIVGAAAVALEGVKTWDLRALAAIANSGVTLDPATNTVIIDPRGDYFSNTATAGGLVPFIQNFDIFGDYSHLGGLAASSVFHATPGVSLAFDGNIEMDRNWNLAAGTVNTAGAIAAGLMKMETFKGVNGATVTTPYVVPGADAALFANYVSMVYRTGGSVYGEAPDVAFEASGNLTLNASINDGFFQFRDQTNPDYLAAIIPVSSALVTIPIGYYGPFLGLDPIIKTDGVFFAADRAAVMQSAAPTAQSGAVPYTIAGNAISPDKSGDPFGSAALFPLLANNAVADSASLKLVAGAAIDRSAAGALTASADPLAVDRTAAGLLSIGGNYTYSYGGQTVSVGYGNDLSQTYGQIFTASNVSSSSTWLSDVLAKSRSVSNSVTGGANLFYGTAGGQAPLIGSSADAKKIDQPGDLIIFNLNLSPNGTIPGSSIKPAGAFSSAALRDVAKISDPSNPQYDAYLHNLYVSNATTPTAGGDFFTVVDTSGDPYTSTVANKLYLVTSVKTAAYILQKYVDPLFNTTANVTTATVNSLVRTGTGSIGLAAAGTVDLTGGPRTQVPIYTATLGSIPPVQLGGAAVYTAGHPADTSVRTVLDPATGETVTVDPTALLQTGTNFSTNTTYDYGNLLTGEVASTGTVGVLIADDVYAEGGGDVSVTAGGDVLGRRDLSVGTALYYGSSHETWNGSSDEPWRTGAVSANTWAQIDPQLYRSGVGALGGGDIAIDAGGNVSDLTVTATDSLATANVTGGAAATKALMTFGRGDVSIAAGNNIVGGLVDVASGSGRIAAGGDIISAGLVNVAVSTSRNIGTLDSLLRLHLSDATVDITAGGSAAIQGVSALGPVQYVQNGSTSALASNLNAAALYSPNAALDIVANGSVRIPNGDDSLLTSANLQSPVVGQGRQAIYPGTLDVASLTGDLAIVPPASSGSSAAVLLMPSALGDLRLLAGGSIASGSIAMLDADPGTLPGLFTAYSGGPSVSFAGGTAPEPGTVPLTFPAVLPGTTSQQRLQQHRSAATHQDDPEPVRIYAGTDIGSTTGGLSLSLPKAARIEAGRDIINMMFFGQNLSATDITRIVAGRDIVGTSTLASPGTNKPVLATLEGNTFVIGGPGNFMLEAGRDLGPFLNSATTGTTTPISYGGGILSVGNEWNPWLPAQGANVTVLFGVAKGENYDGLRDYYLNPANVANLPDYLFEQVSVDSGDSPVTVSGTVADRSKPVYAPLLIQWMQQNEAVALTAAYGTTTITYQQAYTAFAQLPELTQRLFLNQVYFNELKQTSIPTSPSYLKYARGYQAVNTLFPAADGYTANELGGGSNGANTPIVTGNLDLRLATIETSRGGNIEILGPGGRVIAGSTVRTSAQAARRAYAGVGLLEGLQYNLVVAQFGNVSPISSIPSGYEGVLTLRGGSISTFTDGDFLLNQSRVFTEQGGDIVMWSSNADLNAGQGPKTSANFPPVQVIVDQNAFSQLDQVGATTGAGIAALRATPDSPESDVYLIAPRGTVDFGDAGVRVSGDLFVAAAQVANADNAQVGGNTFGVPTAVAVDTAGLEAASNAAAAGAQATPHFTPPPQTDLPSIITVEVLGYGGDNAADDEEKRRHGK